MNKVNKWLIALSVVLPTMIEIIDTSVVNVSLGHIGGSLSASYDEATWAITAYLVSNAIVIPITGWLGRVFGRKRYIIFSVCLFTVSSFMCGSSRTLSMLIFFRILQGLGGGALQPTSQAILLETFPVAEHGMAMAVFGIGVMFGPIVGPIMGGWITDNWSWNWIFYINIPIGIISIILIALFIHDPPYLKRIKAKIDFRGLLLIATGLVCLQMMLDRGQREDWFSSAFIIRLAIVAVVALILFIIVERKSAEPVVNLRIFKNVSFASGNIIQFSAFFVLFGSIILLPLYVQQLMGYNALLAGLVLAPGGIATLISMPIAGRLVTRVNPKGILITGLLITAYSTFMMTRFNLYSDFNMICWSRIVMGLGMGFVFIPLMTMTLSSVKKEEMGNATGVFNLLRNLGGSFGVAFVATLLARRAQLHQLRFSEHLNIFDPRYQFYSAHAGNAAIYQRLLRESNMAAFTDTFYMSTIILLCILPLVFFLKRAKSTDAPVAAH